MFPLGVSVQVCRQHFHAAIGVFANHSNILTSVFDVMVILHIAWKQHLLASWVVELLSLFAWRVLTWMLCVIMSRLCVLRGEALATFVKPA